MPTAESVAIREESAIGRIKASTETIIARTGKELPELNLNFRFAPMERQALTLEFLADLLEELTGIFAEPIDPDDPDDPEKIIERSAKLDMTGAEEPKPEPEEPSGDDHTTPSRISPKRKAK